MEDTPEKTHLVKTVRVFVYDNETQQRIEDRKVEKAYVDLRAKAEALGCVVMALTLSSVCASHDTDVIVVHTITAQIVSKQAIMEAQAAQRFGLNTPRRG